METNVHMQKTMLSMTLSATELEMTARILELSGEVDMAITLDNLAAAIRNERNNYCHKISKVDN